MSLAYETAWRPAHPLQAILLGYPIALFTGALAADIAYLNTAEIQWSNFASWLIVGGLVFGALALLGALFGWVRGLRRAGSGRRLGHLLALAVMWLVGLADAFHHSRDAWSSVGTTGAVLSAVAALLALVAGWLLFARSGAREIGR